MKLAAGTQIVTLIDIALGQRIQHPRGAVGVVVRTLPTGQHRVRFPDGSEVELEFEKLVMLSKWQADRIVGSTQSADSGDDALFERVILRTVIGSQAYGLATEESDVDYRGIYLPSADMNWSLAGAAEQIEREETQEAYWELKKFIVLALKANPNVLECLYSPMVTFQSPLAEELCDARDIFLSQLAFQTFGGYVISQFKRMQADLRNHGQFKWKQVMHLIRLQLTGIELLRSGRLQVDVGQHRSRLMAIRLGEVPWQEIEKEHQQLNLEVRKAYEVCSLPPRPDYQRANRILLNARRAVARGELP